MTTNETTEEPSDKGGLGVRLRRPEWALVGCTLVIAAAMVVAFVSPLPLWSLEGPPRSALEHLTLLIGPGNDGLVRFGGAELAALAAYLYSVRIAPAVKSSRVIATSAGLLGLVMFLGAPTGSYDIYHYLAEGRVAAHYHLNPLLVAPMSVPGAMSDSVLRAAQSWGTLPGRYGPVHLLIVQLVASVAGDNLALGIAGVKLFALSAYLLSVLAIGKVAERISIGSGAVSAVAFALNPIILFDGVGCAHTDIFMAALASLGVAALLTRRAVLGMVLIVASALVKFMTAPLVVYAAIYTLRSGGPNARSRTVVALGSGALFGALVYLPYFDGWSTLPFASAGVQQSVSLHAIVVHVAPGLLAAATRVFSFAGAGICAAAALHVWKRPTGSGLLSAALGASFALTFLVSQMWWPWYTITLLAFATPLGQRAREAAFALTTGAVTATVVFMWRERFGVGEWNGTAYNFLMAGAAFGPVLSWGLVSLLRPAMGHAGDGRE